MLRINIQNIVDTVRLPLDDINLVDIKQQCLNIDTVVKILLKIQQEKFENWTNICQSQIPNRMLKKKNDCTKSKTSETIKTRKTNE